MVSVINIAVVSVFAACKSVAVDVMIICHLSNMLYHTARQEQ